VVVMKSYIFCDITPCSPLKVNRFHMIQYLFVTCFLLGLFYNFEDGGKIFLPERQLHFNELHDVVSKKITFFKVYTNSSE
jgi:hypothetical protein